MEASFPSAMAQSSTTSPQSWTTKASPIAMVQFHTEPPPQQRKSTFFSFTILLYDRHQQPIAVEAAQFTDFLDTGPRNGAIYKLELLLSDGTKVSPSLCLQVVDSRTREPVEYEGSARDPALRRVILTHSVLCSRCSSDRLCGNSVETPSSPLIVDGFRLKFFLKCNQNCVTAAGNPRNTRRFQLSLATTEGQQEVLGVSRKFFVHNNSKHPKARAVGAGGVNLLREKKDEFFSEEGKTEMDEDPMVLAISPSEGSVLGGQTIVILGENLRPGLTVMFGAVAAASQFITRHAVRALAPPCTGPATVQVSLALGPVHFLTSAPGQFTYLEEQGLDYGFARLARLLPRHPGDPSRLARAVILQRTADMVEALCSRDRGEQQEVEQLLEAWQGQEEGETRPLYQLLNTI